MVKVKITISTEDGEVLDQFTAETSKTEERNWFAQMIRSLLEHKFNVEDVE